MIVSNNSTNKRLVSIYEINTTWREVHTSSSSYLIKLRELSSIDVVAEVRELVNKLVQVANVKRIRAVAPRFPNLHHIDFELELPLGTELSDEVWNNVQDLVIDYEWKLRDITSEKWYFHAQVVDRLSLLQDAKVIADSDDKQRVEAGIRIWSSPPLKLVVY